MCVLSPRQRSAFTLVELLVVIAIIGMLVALLLPAVNAARSAARRMTCKSRIKNLALGVLNYESSHGTYPPGFVIQPPNEESWGWTSFILPYIEEQPLYDSLGVGDRRLADLFIAAGRNLNSPEIALVQTSLPIYRCPSDPTPDLLPDNIEAVRAVYPVVGGSSARHFRGRNTPPRFLPATSNYMGVKGYWDNPWCRPNSGRADALCENNGVLFGNSKIGTRQITDGTSKTFMIGERHFRCLSGSWIGARNPPGPDMWSSYYVLGRANIKMNHPTTGAHNTCTEGFSSDHTGGAHFAMCDGSVHFIDESISFNNANNGKNWAPDAKLYNVGWLGVYQRFASRNDGAVGVEPNSGTIPPLP